MPMMLFCECQHNSRAHRDGPCRVAMCECKTYTHHYTTAYGNDDEVPARDRTHLDPLVFDVGEEVR